MTDGCMEGRVFGASILSYKRNYFFWLLHVLAGGTDFLPRHHNDDEIVVFFSLAFYPCQRSSSIMLNS